jgi:Skp family chaperone for outer membrane proteins
MSLQALKILGGLLPMFWLGASMMAGEIGYLDTDKVASNYHLAISKNEVLNEKRGKVNEDIKRRVKELQNVIDQIKALQAKEEFDLSKVKSMAYDAPQRELQLKGLKLDADLKDFCAMQEAAAKKEDSEIKAGIVKDLEAQLAEFAKEKKLEAVANVSDRDFPYYNKSKDITEEFLARVNAGHEEYVKKMVAKREADRKAAQEKQKAAEENNKPPAKPEDKK